MKIIIIVKPNKKENKVVKIGENIFEIYTNQPAKENKANLDIIQQMSKYFKVSKSKVSISSGLKSKKKILEINI
ncbi:MAG: DUF167 family protein [Candidatus Paceibacterota bacterium]|jgi:hypothetical protein